MVLLMKGSGVQRKDWNVNEPVAAGYCRVYLVEAGNVIYEQSGQKRQLLTDTLYIFPATVPYRMVHDPEKPLQCLWFHIDFFPVRLSSLIELPLVQNKTLLLICRLLQELNHSGSLDTEYGKSVTAAFSQYLQQEYLPKQLLPMAETVEYIREHYRDHDLNVNAISTHFGCTTEHFIRTFTKAMGITPYQYLLNMRMYEARRLLLENKPVGETAAWVGYDDPRSFSHAFQKKYAVSPSKFRKSNGLLS